MKETLIKEWENILDLLKTEYQIPHIMIDIWIRALSIKEVTDTTIILSMDEKFGNRGIEFIKKNMYDVCLDCAIEATLSKSYELRFCVEGEEFLHLTEDSDNTKDGHIMLALERSKLNPEYTFDSFVIDNNNRCAHAVCVTVAGAPASAYNPLFLYSGAGLGKTHLMQAIAQKMMNDNQELKVLYVTGETFYDHYINAHRCYKFDEFRMQYRNLDVLLVDDIDFLVGKNATQVDLCEIFSELYDDNKQIIFSCCKHPKEMRELERWMRDTQGVCVEIHAPDYETRIAILKEKAMHMQDAVISEKVYEYMASNITNNVRMLEGALKKIDLFSEKGEHIILEKVVHLIDEIID